MVAEALEATYEKFLKPVLNYCLNSETYRDFRKDGMGTPLGGKIETVD
jgi:hypothetical protein